MKKLITVLASTGLLTLTLGLVGCGETSTSTAEKKVSTPSGTTTVTDKTTVKQTGNNPPPAGTTNPTPPKN
jgi:hypothetical protein